MPDLHTLARYAVFTAFTLSVLVACASWLVRARHVSPFGALGRMLRAASDPVIRPVEGRLVRLGGNPVNAGWWVVVGMAVGGGGFLSLLGWVVGAVYGLFSARRGGPPAVVGFPVGPGDTAVFPRAPAPGRRVGVGR